MLERNRLLMQKSFEADGQLFVTCQTFLRMPSMLIWWELTEEENICFLRQRQTGMEESTDTQRNWILENGGVILLWGSGADSPFWYAGAIRAYLIENEEG